MVLRWIRLDAHRWDRLSQVMVSLSILAFLPLQLPQIWRNVALISTHDPGTIAQMQVIPVLGYGSGMVANLLLMCYLADRGERWGAIVQWVGIVTSGIVVTQLFRVGLVNPSLFMALAIGMGVGVSFNLIRLGRIREPGGFDRLWLWWKNGLNILGLALFPLIFTGQLRESFWPNLPPGFGLTSSSLLVGLSSTALLDDRFAKPGVFGSILPLFRRYWAVMSGWTANLLFMFGPLAQLMLNLVHPESIAVLALPTQALSVLGNLLILARSGTLFLRGEDRVWAVGGFWEVTVRGLVFLTIAYYGFMPWLWFAGYALGVGLYGLWIYHNARPGGAAPQEYDREPMDSLF